MTDTIPLPPVSAAPADGTTSKARVADPRELPRFRSSTPHPRMRSLR